MNTYENLFRYVDLHSYTYTDKVNHHINMVRQNLCCFTQADIPHLVMSEACILEI